MPARSRVSLHSRSTRWEETGPWHFAQKDQGSACQGSWPIERYEQGETQFCQWVQI